MKFVQNIIRILYRNLFFTSINIAGLSFSIACALLIFLWVDFQFGFDSYHENHDEIYRIIYNQEYPNQTLKSAVSPMPLGNSLVHDFPEIINYSRYSIFFGEVLISHKEKRFYEKKGAYADPGFLEIFEINFIVGDESNALLDPYSIVLTESFARKYFGDENPINKIMLLEAFAPLKVTGVISDVPKNSTLQFDFLVPLILMEKWGTDLNDWNNWGHSYTYIQTTKNTQKEQLQNKIANYLDKHNLRIKGTLILQPLPDIHLNRDIVYDNYTVKNNKILLYFFAFVGIIILLVASINYMYLSTAKYSTRAREVGIRKIVGASKFRLYIQFFFEAFFVVLIAFQLGLVFTEILRTIIENLSGFNLEIHYNTKIFLISFLALLFIVAVTSIYPSYFLSSFNLTQVLKGILRSSKKAFFYRKILVVFQFTLAIALIIITINVFQQVNFIRKKDLGFNINDIVTIQLRGNIINKFNEFKTELLQNSNIKLVSSGSSFTTINSSTSDDANWNKKNPDDNFEIFSSGIDFDFLELFEVPLIEGRYFSADFGTDSSHAFIVNETAVKMMNLKNPVGEQISFIGKEGNIIGVAKDYHYASLFEEIGPLIISIRNDWKTFAFIKLVDDSKNRNETLQFIEDTWKKYSPKFPFSYELYDKVINDQYNEVKSISKTILYFSILGIMIALLGLFALSYFLIEYRTKEIGIRKVNGASIYSIVKTINIDFIVPICIAFVIACPLAFYITSELLENFAYQTKISAWSFILGGIISIFVTILTTSYQSIIAARKNPVDCLRYE